MSAGGHLGSLLGSRRAKLLAVLAVASLGIGALAVQAAGSAVSYYVTPEEFATQLGGREGRWRVGGRVVEGSVVDERGRPVAFQIVGEHGETMQISYDGVKPNLFGPRAFVVVEGTAEGPGRLRASSVIIKHESEFVTDAGNASNAR